MPGYRLRTGKPPLAAKWPPDPQSMQRLEVSHDGGSVLLVVFFREGWHFILDPALDNKGHMCTTNLELQKARGILTSIRVLTMAVSTALKEKPSSSGCQVFRGERRVSRCRLLPEVVPIDAASRKCRDQDEDRRANASHRTLDFERGHDHGTPPPLKSSSPPKYPAAATNPEANNIKIRYRHSPVRDIASLTTSLQTAKATRRPKAGQTNR
jgi:hypothetical protein